jgi:undecaprenyl-diphosphatase
LPVLRRHAQTLIARTFRLAREEIGALAVICTVAGSIWGFVTLADEVSDGETESFDRAVLLAFRDPSDASEPLGPPWIEEAVRDVTALGSTVVLIFVTLAVLGYLLLVRKRGAALLVFVAVAGGIYLGSGLKAVFERPRPALATEGPAVFTASFPSNHAMLSAVVYLTLGALLARLEAQRRVKAYILAIFVFVTIAVGLSRLYLGVHWPTDVLAGWCIGAAWAMGIWAVALWLQRRGRVERSGTPG